LGEHILIGCLKREHPLFFYRYLTSGRSGLVATTRLNLALPD
jgi:hypothetical protein